MDFFKFGICLRFYYFCPTSRIKHTVQIAEWCQMGTFRNASSFRFRLGQTIFSRRNKLNKKKRKKTKKRLFYFKQKQKFNFIILKLIWTWGKSKMIFLVEKLKWIFYSMAKFGCFLRITPFFRPNLIYVLCPTKMIWSDQKHCPHTPSPFKSFSPFRKIP